MTRTGDTNTKDNEESERKLCICLKGSGIPRKRRRVNGFQLPLHPQQIVGWIALIFTSTTTIFVLLPGLQPNIRFQIIYLILPLYAGHFITNVITTLLDPAEEELRVNKCRDIVPEFDRQKHRHVIENGRCHLCNITCSGSKTKHCSICNKCVSRFDHHCMWLNHCIGKRNYPMFLVSVFSAMVLAFVTLSIVVMVFVYYFTDPTMLTIHEFDNHFNMSANITETVSTKEVIFLSFVFILGVLALVVAVLLTHLYLFHLFIMHLCLTTYEYIKYQQERNVVTVNSDSSRSCCCSGHCPSLIENGKYHDKFKISNINGLDLAKETYNGSAELAIVSHLDRETGINVVNSSDVLTSCADDPNRRNLKRKQNGSLCHNQIDPVNTRKHKTNGVSTKEISLSPSLLKSRFKTQGVSNIRHSDDNSNLMSNLNVNSLNVITNTKKLLSPILEANNEVNSLSTMI